jgi:hypothetical protein
MCASAGCWVSERPQDRVIGVLAAGDEQLAVAAGNRGQRDVVKRAAERVPNRADVVDGGRGVRPGPDRRDRHFD